MPVTTAPAGWAVRTAGFETMPDDFAARYDEAVTQLAEVFRAEREEAVNQFADRLAQEREAAINQFYDGMALQREQPDLIVCGRNSADAETGQVGPELAELLGLDVAEIAQVTDSPEGSVKVRLMRGRHRLQKVLEALGAEEAEEVDA